MKYIINNNVKLNSADLLLLVLSCQVNYPKYYENQPEDYKWVKHMNFCDVDYIVTKKENTKTINFDVEYNIENEKKRLY